MTGRAFTLLEVLVALALTIVLTTVAYAMLWNLSRDRGAILARIESGQDAGDLLDVLEADLESSFVEDPVLGAGVRGHSGGLTVLSRGVHLRALTDGADATSQALGLSDTIEAVYSLDGGAIVRRSALIDARGERRATDERRFVARSMRLRFHDGAAWRASFDSRSSGFLPAAVEVRIFTETDPAPAEGSTPAASANAPSSESAPASASSVPGSAPAPDRSRVIAIPDGGSAASPSGGGGA
jgi:hypothetical protein